MSRLFEQLSLKIRRRESPFYKHLYLIAKWIRRANIPVVWPMYHLLYAERGFRLSIWHWCKRFFYYEPIFKTRCEQVGKGLTLLVGIPQVLGHLTMRLGENVTLHGASTFQGAKVFEKPTLIVGDNSHIGYMVTISVGCDVRIGNNVLIGNRVTIVNYDGHPLNPDERHLSAPAETSRPITMHDNVWIGDNCLILKGVTIGEGSVVAAGSVVTKDVPPNCLAFGNPAQCRPLMT